MVEMTATIDPVLVAKEAFLSRMIEIPELDQALGYIPNSVDSTALVMRFIDEELVAKAMNKLHRVRYVFMVELYCYGFERPDIQDRFERVVLQKRQILRTDPLLGHTIKKAFEVVRLGDPQVVPLFGNPVVRQQWRYSYEMEARG